MQPKDKRLKALLIVVHYGAPGPTLELLRCLSRLECLSELYVMILENKSGAGSSRELQDAISRLANCELFELTANAGYFGAAKAGLDQLLERHGMLPDWVIVCNHDVLIEDTDFFSKLFSQDPMAAGVIAPRIRVLPGRVDQNPFMTSRPGWLRWTQLRLVNSFYGAATVWDWLYRQKRAAKTFWLALRGRAAAISNCGRQSIYAPHGAFMIFSRRYFEAGGYLDGNLFLYGEEISVAEICRSLGLAVIYEPSLCVVHNEHASTGRRITRFTYECQKNALRYLTARYLTGSGSPVESRTGL
jgi:GT2 family glycosyltransferase